MIGLCGCRFAVHWACDIDGANLLGPKIVVRHKAEGFKAKKGNKKKCKKEAEEAAAAVEAHRAEIEAMPDGHEKEAALVALAEEEKEAEAKAEACDEDDVSNGCRGDGTEAEGGPLLCSNS